jgi:rhodanese-related sulfurtransferase
MIAPAEPQSAHAHFSECLRFETDCSDVGAAMAGGSPDFVLLDVRGPELFRQGHVEGSINVPHRTIDAGLVADWPQDTVFVVYCAGPHCNGAHRAAVRLTSLGRRVKLMIGGITGWTDEGLPLVTGG